VVKSNPTSIFPVESNQPASSNRSFTTSFDTVVFEFKRNDYRRHVGYFTRDRWVKYYGQHVCLSVRSLISQTIYPNFTKFSLRYLWPWLTSGFGNDVTFSHNGINRPESEKLRMFHPDERTGGKVCHIGLHLIKPTEKQSLSMFSLLPFNRQKKVTSPLSDIGVVTTLV